MAIALHSESMCADVCNGKLRKEVNGIGKTRRVVLCVILSYSFVKMKKKMMREGFNCSFFTIFNCTRQKAAPCVSHRVGVLFRILLFSAVCWTVRWTVCVRFCVVIVVAEC